MIGMSKIITILGYLVFIFQAYYYTAFKIIDLFFFQILLTKFLIILN